jgi:hypothetical protein
MRTTISHAKRTIARARQIYRELDYAQRRMFEITTGEPIRRAPESADRHS